MISGNVSIFHGRERLFGFVYLTNTKKVFSRFRPGRLAVSFYVPSYGTYDVVLYCASCRQESGSECGDISDVYCYDMVLCCARC